MCQAVSFCSPCFPMNGHLHSWACIWQQLRLPEQMHSQAERAEPPSSVCNDMAAGPYSLITTAVSADLGTQSGISGEVTTHLLLDSNIAAVVVKSGLAVVPAWQHMPPAYHLQR